MWNWKSYRSHTDTLKTVKTPLIRPDTSGSSWFQPGGGAGGGWRWSPGSSPLGEQLVSRQVPGVVGVWAVVGVLGLHGVGG